MENKYIIAHGTFIKVGDELVHRSTKRRYERKTKKNFKYIAKVDIGKTTRYFYTKDEYDAYLNGKKDTKQKETSKTKKTNIESTNKKVTVTKLLEKIFKKTHIGPMVNIGKRVMDDIKRKAEEDAKRKAEEEVKRKAMEEEIKRQAEEEAKRLTEEADAISEANSPKSWDELKHKDREYTKEEDQAIINPNYVSSWEEWIIDESMTDAERAEIMSINKTYGVEPYEYTINCQSCTLAYDLRRRGYDVEAAPRDDNETWEPDIKGVTTWYEGVTLKDWSVVSADSVPEDVKQECNIKEVTTSIELYDNVSDVFEEMPDGSRGQFCVYWTSGGGHSMSWEKDNGDIIIRDCQSNETISFNEIHKNDSLYNKVDTAFVLRTDDKKITDEALKRVRNADHVEEIDKYIQKLREKYVTGKE